MNKKKKVILLLIIITLVISISYVLSNLGGREELKGTINILVKEDTYNYIIEGKENFEDSNKKTKINVFLNKDISDINEYIKSNDIDIVQGNVSEYKNLDNDLINRDIATGIVSTYKKNFSNARLLETKDNNNYGAVPFTSNPLALYIREDILKEYGYSEGDISTWEDLLNIGIDIFNKTNGEIRIFNKKDWINICALLSIQCIEEYDTALDEDNVLNDKLTFLLDKQLIGFYGEDNYICRITSVSFINEEKYNKWKCINVPSILPGGNRFYDVGGDGLIITSKNNNEVDVISSFVGYITSNIEALTDEMIKGNFFPSSVLSYNNKIIETKVENISGESPFVTLTNISEKALPISNFDEYLDKLKQILTKWVI